MWKEQYRKANDQLPVNQELLERLKKQAEQPQKSQVHAGRWVGLAVAAALTLTFVSVTYLAQPGQQPRQAAEPQVTSTVTAEKKEETIAPSVIPSPEKTVEQPLEQTVQEYASVPTVETPPAVVASPEKIEKPEEKTEEKNQETVMNHATASAREITNVPTMATAPMPESIETTGPELSDPLTAEQTEDVPSPWMPDAASGNSGGGGEAADDFVGGTVAEDGTVSPTPEATPSPAPSKSPAPHGEE